MAINQVQFQKGLSMPEFLLRYGTEAQCRAAIVAMRWPDGFVCPRCQATKYSRFDRGRRTYWQCSACRTQTTATCGTIFQDTRLPLTVWFLAMQLLTQAKNNVSALELKRQLGVRYATAWLLKHKLMQVMADREAGRKLAGRVVIDDAYLGGQRVGGKRGRGSENKVSFVAAVQTTPDGRPLYACMCKMPFTKEAVATWAKHSLSASAEVVSDGLSCFEAVTCIGATHNRTVTGGGTASVKLEQFRAINTLLGNLKTAFSGTYHAFDFQKYAHRYLAEVQYRFNRRFDLAAILGRLLRAAVVTPPHPEDSLRMAESAG